MSDQVWDDDEDVVLVTPRPERPRFEGRSQAAPDARRAANVKALDERDPNKMKADAMDLAVANARLSLDHFERYLEWGSVTDPNLYEETKAVLHDLTEAVVRAENKQRRL